MQVEQRGRLAGGGRETDGIGKIGLGWVDGTVDLVSWTGDITEIQERITNEEASSFADLVADIERGFRHEGWPC